MTAEVLVTDEMHVQAKARALSDQGRRLAVAFGTDDRALGAGFSAWYIFADDRARTFTPLRVECGGEAPRLPSVAAVLPAADWYEREMRDLLGITPVGHPDPRRLVLHEDWPGRLFPLRKDFDPDAVPASVRRPTRPPTLAMPVVEGAGVFEVPVGPVHAGIIEPGHFRFSCVGDSILHLEPRLFYTHKGTEKRAEGRTPDEAMPLVQSLCGVCVTAHAVGFAEAVERAAGAPAPDRARYLRSFLLEMERLYNHVGDVANVLAGFGMQVAIHRGLRLKERLLRLNDLLTGHRYLRWAVAVGGLARDIPDDLLGRAVAEAESVRDDLVRLGDLVLSHDGAVDRMEGTGVLFLSRADLLGCVGVAARASGVDRDSRRDHPHAAYAEVPPRVVVLSEGDVSARWRLRLEEARESVRLLEALRAAAPREGAPFRTAVPPPAPGAWGLAAAESPRGEEIHFVRFGAEGRIDRYKFRSASYADWRALPFTVSGNIVPDFPLINKSFELCYSCTDM